ASLAPDYSDVSIKWIRQVIEALPEDFPVILYAKGMAHQRDALMASGAKVLSLDWTVELARYRDGLEQPLALQGNLDPQVLTTDVANTRQSVSKLLESMRGQRGYIFNLGHGITPQARVENVAALVDTIRNFS
ncbi:MAG: uroporphyrinogen decarboxylase family protein, partial [Verrucomicrobiota bacterium]